MKKKLKITQYLASLIFVLLLAAQAPKAEAGAGTSPTNCPPLCSQTGAGVTKSTVIKDNDPINMATGEHFFDMDLMDLGGILPVNFKIFFGSLSLYRGGLNGLPRNFYTSSNGILRRSPGGDDAGQLITVELGLGKQLRFFYNTLAWGQFERPNQQRIGYEIQETSDYFYLLDPVGEAVHTFKKDATLPSYLAKEQISHEPSGSNAGNNASGSPSISGDGRYVAFDSLAGDLISGDTNNARDIFFNDRFNDNTTRVSVDSNGAQGNNSSINPSLSPDGRYVAFESTATNLVGSDNNTVSDIFVRDRQTSQTTRVSVDSNGT